MRGNLCVVVFISQRASAAERRSIKPKRLQKETRFSFWWDLN